MVALAVVLAACAEPPRQVEARPPEPPATDPAPAPPPADTAGQAADSATLVVRFLDVGQGDAVLLESGGRVALVDAGPADAVAERLRQLGVDTLDLMVASHNHADHIGGMDAVLDAFPVRFYLDNGFPATTRAQERVLERVEEHGVTYLAPTRRTLSLGAAMVRVLPAPENVPGDDQNNRSLALVVSLGAFEALLTGDSEIELLGALLDRDTFPDVEVMKAAHHGSRNGVTPAWLSRTRPELVVISVGEGNSYGHPMPAALRYYCAGGRTVLATDRHGEVVIRAAPDGTWAVETGRGDVEDGAACEAVPR